MPLYAASAVCSVCRSCVAQGARRRPGCTVRTTALPYYRATRYVVRTPFPLSLVAVWGPWPSCPGPPVLLCLWLPSVPCLAALLRVASRDPSHLRGALCFPSPVRAAVAHEQAATKTFTLQPMEEGRIAIRLDVSAMEGGLVPGTVPATVRARPSVSPEVMDHHATS